MNLLDTIGLKITSEAKTIIGILGIIFGFMVWGMDPYSGLIDIIFIIIPAILLVVPSETVKSSKILGIIFVILLLIIISSLYSAYHNIPGDLYTGIAGAYSAMEKSITLQIILSIYSLFCAFLLIIPSQNKNTKFGIKLPIKTNKTEKQYNKFCSECGKGLYDNAKFCPSCGTKVDNKN